MIRIRTGASWRLDPRVTSALANVGERERRAFARELVDALAIEVDGVDLAKGLAEAPLLPSLEELLLAIAKAVSGAPATAVVLGEGGLELLIRRRGESALLTVVELGRPSRILARDVEVEVQALAAAALEAAAGFCRDLSLLLPSAERDTKDLNRAARILEKAQPRTPVPRAPFALTAGQREGEVSCAIDVEDHDGLLAEYEGGRPDLGSLLVPGSVTLKARDGAALFSLPSPPFLTLRDLVGAADRALCAARRKDPFLKVPLARSGHEVLTLELLLAKGETLVNGRRIACAPLELLRAFALSALEFSRIAREKNPRQRENAHLTELEEGALERIAELDELAGPDLVSPETRAVRGASLPGASGPPLGPGKLRRLSFRRIATREVGEPTALFRSAGGIVAAGRGAIICLDPRSGEERWRSAGATLACAFAGGVLAAQRDRVRLLSPRTGRALWERELPGAAPTGAAMLTGGPLILAEPGAVSGLDRATGALVFRFRVPGAQKTHLVGFGRLVVSGSDTGFLYGHDAGGRLVWRVRAPGPLLRPPTAFGGLCLALCETRAKSALLALDAATGVRVFEAPLDLTPSGAPSPWGRRLAIPGTVGGDPVVTVLGAGGEMLFTVAPALLGPPSLAPAKGLLVVRGSRGGLIALGREGNPVWSRAEGPSGELARGLAISRELVVTSGDGLSLHDLSTGDLVGALPGVSAKYLEMDPELSLAALDGYGLVCLQRLSTHLSVL